jgi:glycine oxidase
VTTRRITVAGAGILGVWQALRRAGHHVRLMDAAHEPFSAAASRLAGAMLVPDCEAEASPVIVRDWGRHGLMLWRATYPGLICNGSLVVSHARDRGELVRFARQTEGHTALDSAGVADLEPDLAGRFAAGLHFAHEAHMVTPHALAFLLAAATAAGVEAAFGQPWTSASDDGDVVIDCRGLGARDDLPKLRGVRGERFLIRTDEVRLSRPVHLLHPRQPLYVVPWDDGRFIVGATVVESEDPGPVTVRSALELLGLAYALHPAFGEAEVLDAASGLRPSFPDNVPRAIVHANGRRIDVNGAWRHGFLLAPVLAEAVVNYLADGTPHPLLDTA